MELGRIGVWSFLDALSAAEVAEFAQKVEALGYRTLWIPEGLGRDAIASSAWLLASTRKLNVATGIANIYARDAVTSAAAGKTLAEQSGGRFLFGLGVSHQPSRHRRPRPRRVSAAHGHAPLPRGDERCSLSRRASRRGAADCHRRLAPQDAGARR